MADTVAVTMPPLEEGTESVIAAWLKKPGDTIRAHEPLVEVSTDKAIMEVPAPAAGVLLEIVKRPDERVAPGDLLARIRPEPAPAPLSQAPASRPPSRPITESTGQLSPAVRALIQQHRLDPGQIRGTGRGGRITHEDVLNHLKQAPATAAETTYELRGRRVPHTPMRRRIAQHMVESLLKTAPHVTAVYELDMSAAVAHRQRHAAEFQQRGIKLTYTAYFVAAAAKALQAVPEVNSRWHEDALELYSDCNIGIATAIEGGLVVPVIHKAQDVDLFGIASRLQELTQKARRGRIERSEIQHGTFTITNHGVGGSLIATPVINQPQAAILGVGKLEKRVIVAEVSGADAIQVRPMVYLTLTIDHRVLDGFQANTFMTRFLEACSQW